MAGKVLQRSHHLHLNRQVLNESDVQVFSGNFLNCSRCLWNEHYLICLQAAAARVIEQLLNAADAHTEILPLTTHEDSHRMIDPDIALPPLQAMQWRKALINVAINPLTAILGVSNGVLASTCNSHSVDGNPFAELMDCVINEAIDVLDAVENEMAPSIMQAPRWTQSAAQHLARRQRLVDVVEQTAVRTATNRSSMLSDVLRKNAVPELDGIVGQ